MPKGGKKNRGKSRRGRTRGVTRDEVNTIKRELRTSSSGAWSKKRHTIGLPAYQVDTKIYRRCRIQNTSGNNPWNIAFADIIGATRPRFQYYNLISATFYGPMVASSGAQTQGGATDTPISSEICCVARSNWHENAGNTSPTSDESPIAVALPGAGRRVMCRWHWFDADQNFQFINGTTPGSTRVCELIFGHAGTGSNWQKDTYCDVTVRGWGSDGISLSLKDLLIPPSDVMLTGEIPGPHMPTRVIPC